MSPPVKNATTPPVDPPTDPPVDPLANPQVNPDEVLMTAQDWLPDASTAIPLSGLLASDPDLAEATKTAPAWQAALDAYLTSERP